MTRALLAAATLFLFAGSAFAADMPLKAPPAPAPAPTWTGWHIGVNGGGGWGSVKPTASSFGSVPAFSWRERPGRGRGRVQGLPYVGGFGRRAGRLPVPGGSRPGHRRPGCRLRLVRSQGIRQQRLHPLPRHDTDRLQLELRRQIAVTDHCGRAYRPRPGNVVSRRLGRRCGHPSVLHRKLHRYLLSIGFKQLVQQGRGRLDDRRRPEFRFAQHWSLRGEYLHTEFANISGFGQIACTPGVGNCVGAGFRTTFQFGSRFTETSGASLSATSSDLRSRRDIRAFRNGLGGAAFRAAHR